MKFQRGDFFAEGRLRVMNENLTLQFYNDNSESYSQSTIYADMSGLCDEFLRLLPADGCILDLGCGSGRDSKYFLSHGREVISVDGSKELCRIAGEFLGHEVICCDFREYTPREIFAGIWASASLLHLEEGEILRVIERLSRSLIDGGIFYMSFKHGNFSGIRDGRHYTDFDEDRITNIIGSVKGLEIVKLKISEDVRNDFAGQKWINVFCIRH